MFIKIILKTNVIISSHKTKMKKNKHLKYLAFYTLVVYFCNEIKTKKSMKIMDKICFFLNIWFVISLKFYNFEQFCVFKMFFNIILQKYNYLNLGNGYKWTKTYI